VSNARPFVVGDLVEYNPRALRKNKMIVNVPTGGHVTQVWAYGEGQLVSVRWDNPGAYKADMDKIKSANLVHKSGGLGRGDR
jgi:hypothetical protein